LFAIFGWPTRRKAHRICLAGQKRDQDMSHQSAVLCFGPVTHCSRHSHSQEFSSVLGGSLFHGIELLISLAVASQCVKQAEMETSFHFTPRIGNHKQTGPVPASASQKTSFIAMSQAVSSLRDSIQIHPRSGSAVSSTIH
jgi:hypothetical protein